MLYKLLPYHRNNTAVINNALINTVFKVYKTLLAINIYVLI